MIPHTFCHSSFQTMLELPERYHHTIRFLSEVIKKYWRFQKVTIKQCYTNCTILLILHNTFSGSYCKIILHSVSEFISNTIYNSRITTKQYYKMLLFYKFLSNKTDIVRELLPNYRRFSPDETWWCTRELLFLSQIWTYSSKSLLTEISAKSTFRKVFDFKKL